MKEPLTNIVLYIPKVSPPICSLLTFYVYSPRDQMLYIEKSVSQIKPFSTFFCCVSLKPKKAGKISTKKTFKKTFKQTFKKTSQMPSILVLSSHKNAHTIMRCLLTLLGSTQYLRNSLAV